MSYGLRTVCATCARIQDESSSGNWLFGIAMLLGWLVCAAIGLKIMGASDGAGSALFGFFMLFGGPVFIVGGIIQHEKRKAIVEKVLRENDELNGQQFDLEESNSTVSTNIQPGETIESWVKRCAVIAIEGKSLRETQQLSLEWAKELPPKVNESMPEWLDRLNAENERQLEQLNDNSPKSLPYNSSKSVKDWVSESVDCLYTPTNPGDGEALDNMKAAANKAAKILPPKEGESWESWQPLAFEMFDKKIVKPYSLDSVKTPNETIEDWIGRVGYNLASGDTDSIIPTLIQLAHRIPPNKGETAADWANRAAPHLENQESNK